MITAIIMVRSYFKGFEFSEPVYREEVPLEAYLIRVPENEIVKSGPKKIETIYLDDCLIAGDIEWEELCNREISSLGEIMPNFKDILKGVNRKINTRLSMRNREMKIVSDMDMRPKTPEEAQKLVDRYGEYMRDGGNGDCTQLGDGSFLMRVGLRSSGKREWPSALYIVSHEFGHTLGYNIDDVNFEELKADAFASICERVDTNAINSSYEEINEQLNPDHPHDVAKHRLGELLRANIGEGAILSHLIGRKFGRYSPRSWESS